MTVATSDLGRPSRRPRLARPVRGDRVALALVVAAAALARSARIPALEITGDEAFSWSIARFPVGELLRRLSEDAHPPLHYLALQAWSAAFGSSLASLRGLSVILSCVTLVGMSWFVGLVRDGSVPGAAGSRNDQNWTGVLAAALLALSPRHDDGSVLLRMYAMGSCLSVLNAGLFLSLLRAPTGRPAAWAAYVATTAAFALTHYYAVFSLAAPALVVAVLACSGRQLAGASASKLVSRFALAWFAASLLYLPWLPSHLAQLRTVLEGFWIPDLTSDAVENLALGYLTGLRRRDPWLDALAVATAAAVCGILAARVDRGRGLVLALIALPWAGGVAFSVLTKRTILLDRYLVFSHQYYLAALALAIAEAPGRPARLGLAALALLGAVHARSLDEESGVGRGKTLEPLARRIACDRRPGQVVVIGELGMALRLGYYLDRLGIAGPLRIVGGPSTVGGHRVYLATVVAGAWVDEPGIGSLPQEWIWFVETDKSKLVEAPPNLRQAGSFPFIEMNAPRMILHLYQRIGPGRAEAARPG